MAQKCLYFFSFFLFGVVSNSLQGAQQQVVDTKVDNEERELKTFIDRTKKMLENHGCVPVNEQNYPAVFKSVQELLAKCAVGNPEVFVIESDSVAGTALLTNGIHFFNNARVWSRNGIASLIIIDKGLVDLLTTDELKSIIAHEMAHIKYKSENSQRERKLEKGYMYFSRGLSVPFFVYACYRSTFPSVLERLKGVPATLIGGLLWASAPFFNKWRARCEEKAVDLRAVSIMHSKVLVRALEKMDQRINELYPVCMRNYAWWAKWFPYVLDHPVMKERKKYIEAYQLPELAPNIETIVAVKTA